MNVPGYPEVLGEPASNRLVLSLKNLLQSRTFCDFLKYEWLYSLVDSHALLGANDFQIVLKENFCRLKSRLLTRAQWHCIRKLIGKPRRFSQAFLMEERRCLNIRRQNLWSIQNHLNNLPPELSQSKQMVQSLEGLPSINSIPFCLAPGTQALVSSLSPVKGFYLGRICSVSPDSSMYSVNLEKEILSHSSLNNTKLQLVVDNSHLIPESDIFVCSTSSVSAIPVENLKSYLQSNLHSSIKESPGNFRNYSDENAAPYIFKQELSPPGSILNMDGCKEYELPGRSMLDYSNLQQPLDCNTLCDSQATELCDQTDAMSDFLLSLAKIHRILSKKQKSVAALREMNDIAESQTSAEESPVTVEFQQKYATLVLHLDELNQQLKYHIGIVLLHITDIASDYGMQDVAFVTDWRRRCEDEAFDIVNRLKTSQGPTTVDESKLVLVGKLTSILTLLAHLQENRMTNSELGCIEEVFTDIRQHLHPSNLKCFEQSVEQLISHIVLNLSPSILPIPTSNGASGASGGNTNADESACPRQSTT
uniref:DIRP domain-containing protein n=1 Tax=Mesocestoides corti TaxID=53468 RepID=A0A5K3EYV2_MESCO